MQQYLVILLLFATVPVCSQDLVYFTKYAYEADWDVFFTPFQNDADVVINRVDYQHQLRSVQNSWLTVRHRHRATLIVREVHYITRPNKTLRIYVNGLRGRILDKRWVENYKRYF